MNKCIYDCTLVSRVAHFFASSFTQDSRFVANRVTVFHGMLTLKKYRLNNATVLRFHNINRENGNTQAGGET